MKIIIVLAICSFFSCEQKENSKEERIRGYIFSTAHLENPVKKRGDTITMEFDQIKTYFFEPILGERFNFKKAIENSDKPISNSLYLPIGLTESSNSISFTTTSLRIFLKDSTIHVPMLDRNEEYKDTPKTVIELELKERKLAFEVVYIDGIWEKIKMPFKWVEGIPIGRYSTSSLDRNKKEYDYYILKKVNKIKYNVDIDDVLIKVLK